MKSYQILSHTADLRLEITGDTIGDLFAAGLEGMNAILKTDNTMQKGTIIQKAIEISSPDTTSLLIDFLSEVLTLSLEENALFNIKLIKISDNKLTAQIVGCQVDKFEVEIKAVTRHEAEVKKNNDGVWTTHIIFDI